MFIKQKGQTNKRKGKIREPKSTFLGPDFLEFFGDITLDPEKPVKVMTPTRVITSLERQD